MLRGHCGAVTNRCQLRARSCHLPVMQSRWTWPRRKQASNARGSHDGRFSDGAQGATIGRSPLLPSQPDQSIIASGQRTEFPVHVHPAAGQSDRRRAGWSACSGLTKAQAMSRRWRSTARLRASMSRKVQVAGTGTGVRASFQPSSTYSRHERIGIMQHDYLADREDDPSSG